MDSEPGTSVLSSPLNQDEVASPLTHLLQLSSIILLQAYKLMRNGDDQLKLYEHDLFHPFDLYDSLPSNRLSRLRTHRLPFPLSLISSEI
jgi:hypothetical protein